MATAIKLNYSGRYLRLPGTGNSAAYNVPYFPAIVTANNGHYNAPYFLYQSREIDART